jgi:hypothetical protein
METPTEKPVQILFGYQGPKFTRRCSRGHEWEEQEDVSYFRFFTREDGAVLCYQCVTEFLAERCGIIEPRDEESARAR